jgi:hypothetical protein
MFYLTLFVPCARLRTFLQDNTYGLLLQTRSGSCKQRRRPRGSLLYLRYLYLFIPEVLHSGIELQEIKSYARLIGKVSNRKTFKFKVRADRSWSKNIG